MPGQAYSLLDPWSLVILSFHALFYAWSNQSAALMLKSLLVFSSSRFCAAGTNGCLDLSYHWVPVEEHVSLRWSRCWGSKACWASARVAHL